METNNEIIDKLKESVVSKLKELDPNSTHDCTLIDYILVMVVNQKSKYEMKHNLALFLGKISDDFVNWLFDYLSQMNQSNQNSNSNLRSDHIKSEIANKDEDIEQEKKDINDENIESKGSQQKTESNDETNESTSTESVMKPDVPKKKLKSAIINLINPDEDENDKRKTRSTIANKRGMVNNDNNGHQSDYLPKLKKKRSVMVESGNEKDSIEKVMPAPVSQPDAISMDKERQTKFYVTLDGVKNMFKVDEDLFLMDEELDPELMNEDLTNVDQLTLNNKKEKFQKYIQSNKFERCRYWPSCMNGNNCDYYHPIIKCNLFPHCRFGDKCLYIHPICKYDSICSRKDCPFFHTYVGNKRCQQNNVVCKYFPKCVNPTCEFIHPKVICHYGTACKTFNCPFIHPNQNLPHPSQLKWSSKNKEIEIK